MEVASVPLQSLTSFPSVEKLPPPPSGQTFLFQGQPIGEASLEMQRQYSGKLAGMQGYQSAPPTPQLTLLPTPLQ